MAKSPGHTMTVVDLARMGGLASAKVFTRAERVARATHAVRCREAQRAAKKRKAKAV